MNVEANQTWYRNGRDSVVIGQVQHHDGERIVCYKYDPSAPVFYGLAERLFKLTFSQLQHNEEELRKKAKEMASDAAQEVWKELDAVRD